MSVRVSFERAGAERANNKIRDREENATATMSELFVCLFLSYSSALQQQQQQQQQHQIWREKSGVNDPAKGEGVEMIPSRV